MLVTSIYQLIFVELVLIRWQVFRRRIKRSAFAVRQSIRRELRYAMVMNERSNEHKHVEYLMTLTLQTWSIRRQHFKRSTLYQTLSHARQALLNTTANTLKPIDRRTINIGRFYRAFLSVDNSVQFSWHTITSNTKCWNRPMRPSLICLFIFAYFIS